MKTGLLFLFLITFASTAVNTATDVTGKWKVTLTLPNETILGVALLKQTGDRIEGSVGVNEQNQHPLDGIVEGNRVTLTTHPRPGATVALAKCSLTIDGETMTGTTEGADLGDKITSIQFVRLKE